MIFAQTFKEAIGYSNRYAVALYNMGGGGNPPRKGLVQGQYFVGQILSGGRFHVLNPDRMCCLSEFLNFQLVSKPWRELSEIERSILMMVYSEKKVPLNSLSTELPASEVLEIATGLDKAGYLRRADEPQVVELTPVGEAEIQHRFARWLKCFLILRRLNLVETEVACRVFQYLHTGRYVNRGAIACPAYNLCLCVNRQETNQQENEFF